MVKGLIRETYEEVRVQYTETFYSLDLKKRIEASAQMVILEYLLEQLEHMEKYYSASR